LDALEEVFKCLKGIINYTIHYTSFLGIIEGYSDANWIYDSGNSIYYWLCFYFGWRYIITKYTKQAIISQSTMEANIISLNIGTVESKFIYDIP